jgi:hypothetical protein
MVSSGSSVDRPKDSECPQSREVSRFMRTKMTGQKMNMSQCRKGRQLKNQIINNNSVGTYLQDIHNLEVDVHVFNRS